MNYAAARPQIRSGDLLAWGHERWGSWYDFKVQMVRVFTRSEHCHVGIAWCVGARVFVLEAVQPKVRIYPLSKLLPFYWLPAGDAWTGEAETFALTAVGDPYSELQAVLAFFNRLRIGADHVHECAEYAIEVIRLMAPGFSARATPSAVVQAQQARGAPRYLVTEG